MDLHPARCTKCGQKFPYGRDFNEHILECRIRGKATVESIAGGDVGERSNLEKEYPRTFFYDGGGGSIANSDPIPPPCITNVDHDDTSVDRTEHTAGDELQTYSYTETSEFVKYVSETGETSFRNEKSVRDKTEINGVPDAEEPQHDGEGVKSPSDDQTDPSSVTFTTENGIDEEDSVPKNCSSIDKSLQIAKALKGDWPLTCIKCSISLGSLKIFRTHMLIHWKNSDKHCPLCDRLIKGFHQHFKTHTGETEFSCEVCLQQFRQKGNMLNHVVKKHMNDERLLTSKGKSDGITNECDKVGIEEDDPVEMPDLDETPHVNKDEEASYKEDNGKSTLEKVQLVTMNEKSDYVSNEDERIEKGEKDQPVSVPDVEHTQGDNKSEDSLSDDDLLYIEGVAPDEVVKDDISGNTSMDTDRNSALEEEVLVNENGKFDQVINKDNRGDRDMVGKDNPVGVTDMDEPLYIYSSEDDISLSDDDSLYIATNEVITETSSKNSDTFGTAKQIPRGISKEKRKIQGVDIKPSVKEVKKDDLKGCIRVKKFTCKVCSQTFKQRVNMLKHMSNRHIEVNSEAPGDGQKWKWKCDRCDYLDVRSKGLRAHIKNAHDADEDDGGIKKGDTFNEKANTDASEVARESIQNAENHHPVMDSKDKDDSRGAEYKCAQCEYSNFSEKKVHLHMKNVHNKVKDLSCSMCGFMTGWPHDLAKHVKINHNKIPGSSPRKAEMDYTTVGPRKKIQKLDTPISDSVPEENPKRSKFECGQCSYSSYFESKLNFHNKIKHSKASAPDEIIHNAENDTNTEGSLEAEENIQKADPPMKSKYECTLCDMSSDKEHAVKMHTKVVHNKVKDFPCPMCKYLSGRPADLRSHIKRHDNPCEFTPLFSDGGVQTTDDKAVKYVLKKIKHFACPRCKYLTRWLVDLRRHLSAQHGDGAPSSKESKADSLNDGDSTGKSPQAGDSPQGDETQDVATPTSSFDGKTVFKCGKCDYQSTSKSYTNLHIKNIHDKVRDLSCSKCKYSTGWPLVLSRHMRDKHGEKAKKNPVKASQRKAPGSELGKVKKLEQER